MILSDSLCKVDDPNNLKPSISLRLFHILAQTSCNGRTLKKCEIQYAQISDFSLLSAGN
jgi:hypothetical protein